MFRNVNFVSTVVQSVSASQTYLRSATTLAMPSPPHLSTKLLTKVLNTDKREVAVRIDHHNDGGIQNRIFIKKSSDGSELGTMRYFTWEDHIYIFSMKNTAAEKHSNIGALLHEYAFRDSIRLGKKGNVKLHAIDTSHYFHFLTGFRPYPVHTLAFDMAKLQGLQPLREKYLLNPEDKIAEAEVLDIISAKNLIPALKENTQAAFQVGPDTPVSLYHMMRHGFFKSRNVSREWEEKFAALPNSPRKDTSSWGGHDMYYPAVTIQEKMDKLGITLPTPEITPSKKLSP